MCHSYNNSNDKTNTHLDDGRLAALARTFDEEDMMIHK